MGVIQSDLIFYGSANMPDGDGTTTGGAVDTSKRVFFTDMNTSGDTMLYLSSSISDTATTITVTGYNSAGVIVNETKTLNGTSQVTGSQGFTHLLKGIVGGTTPVGDVLSVDNNSILTGNIQNAGNSTSTTPAYVTLKSGQGASVAIGWVYRDLNHSQLRRIIGLSGDIAYVNRDWSTIPSTGNSSQIFKGFLFEISPNRVSEIRRPFYNAAADMTGGSSRTYYEKIFAMNNNTSTALSVASILKTADPSGAGSYEFALTNSLNDTGTVANRQTAPVSGITAFTTGSSPQTIAVPSPTVLPNGAAPNAAGAQGVWLAMTLAAGAPASYTFTDMQIDGNSP